MKGTQAEMALSLFDGKLEISYAARFIGIVADRRSC